MITYNQRLLNKLQKIPFKEQGPVGMNPIDWSKQMGIENNFSNLPNSILTRHEVRAICQSSNYDDMLGYICIMAWGGQGKGPGGRKHVLAAWNKKDALRKKIHLIKDTKLSRSEKFDLFCKDGKIPGLGPAYFTKLLFFFSPETSSFIMDQWTTKPILLLSNKNIIKHTNDGPSSNNTGVNYDLFCLIIEDLAKKVGCKSGEEMEQLLFSYGSIGKKPRGIFRQVIVDAWKDREKFRRYNHDIVIKLRSHYLNAAN